MISFYIPENEWPEDISKTKPQYSWSASRFGKWNWTLQTFQHLKDAGIECRMTTELTQRGIILAHRSVLPDDYRPHRDQLLVCILAERERHPFAQYHLLQDPIQAKSFEKTIHTRLDNRVLGLTSSYIRYWPQPGLIKRNKNRGNRFENLVFKGMEHQLADELCTREFRQTLKDMGVKWSVESDKQKWPDYSYVDGVIAVREFRFPTSSRKPATKLYNSWLAGVPAILGPEPAFRHEGTPGSDYLEANSLNDVVQHVRCLQEYPELRAKIVARGSANAASYEVPAILKDWQELVDKKLTPILEQWQSLSSISRKGYYRYRSGLDSLRTFQKKVSNRTGLKFNPYT